MKLTIYRPNQIGGCITEIESVKGARIIIDVGKELPGNESGEVVNVKELSKGCSGVFVTHYHGDHIGEFDDVDGGTPIYMGKIAHEIFLNLQETLHKKNVDAVKAFKTFQSRDRIEAGDMIVTPYRVDHSAYDSYMFLIECDGKRVLHTGDFRMHGWSGNCVEAMLKKYIKGKKVDALICEGTMLARNDSERLTEFGLYKKAKKLLRENKSVFVLCSSTNIDTIASFYRAATELDKWVFADGYQRSNLDIVSANANCDLYCFPYVTIYQPGRQKCIERMSDEKGFCMFVRHGGKYGKICKSVMKEFSDNLFIYSMWDGYLEDGTRNNDIYSFVPREHEYLHTSGHAYEEAILRLCEIVEPGIVFPIHSDKPGRLETLRKYGKIKCEVQRLQSRKSVEIAAYKLNMMYPASKSRAKVPELF